MDDGFISNHGKESYEEAEQEYQAYGNLKTRTNRRIPNAVNSIIVSDAAILDLYGYNNCFQVLEPIEIISTLELKYQ